jgi:hypothetical protein
MAADIELIAAIYDAIVDPSGWDEVVKRIVEATKSVAGGLGIRLVAAEEMSALCNTDPYYIDYMSNIITRQTLSTQLWRQ